jgi:hypothetical protein
VVWQGLTNDGIHVFTRKRNRRLVRLLGKTGLCSPADSLGLNACASCRLQRRSEGTRVEIRKVKRCSRYFRLAACTFHVRR